MAIDFPGLVKELEAGITELASTTVKDYVSAAVSDGKELLAQLKEELQKWTDQLEKGQLSPDDFQYNLSSYADLTDMIFLKEKGLAIIQTDKFKNDVIDLISNTVLGKLH